MAFVDLLLATTIQAPRSSQQQDGGNQRQEDSCHRGAWEDSYDEGGYRRQEDYQHRGGVAAEMSTGVIIVPMINAGRRKTFTTLEDTTTTMNKKKKIAATKTTTKTSHRGGYAQPFCSPPWER